MMARCNSAAWRSPARATVALVSDTIGSDSYAGRAIHGALAAAVAHDRLLLIGETEGDPVVEEKLILDFWTGRLTRSSTPACSPGTFACPRCCAATRWCSSTV
jgi:hypothetical protein